MSSKDCISQINYAIPAEPHTPMYLIHKWWARKPHNVVGEYVNHYTCEKEIVLDPFCGSGVTVAEALRSGRKAIGVDLNPMAVFMTRMTVLPASIKKLNGAFEKIRSNVEDDIEKMYITRCPRCDSRARILATVWDRDSKEPLQLRLYCVSCDKKYRKKPSKEDLALLEKIEKKSPPYWVPSDQLFYPDGQPFKKKEINNSIADLYTKRGLVALSLIWHEIEAVDTDEKSRDFLRFWFTSRAHIASKMTPVAKPSPRAHWTEDSTTSFWAIQSYWVPPRFLESNAWMVFESGFNGPQGLIKGKTESNGVIGEVQEVRSYNDLENGGDFMTMNRTAMSLEGIPNDSVDYCFTDPPYGGSIQYFELCALWLSWLRGSESDKRFVVDYGDEITINEQQRKDFEYYHKMLQTSFGEVHRVLKPGRYLTVTFHNTDIKIYNSILKAVVLAGFDLEKVIYQPPARASAKGLLQPFGSAIGDYYIRFRKPEVKRKELDQGELDQARYERIVLESVKRILAERGEPSPYSILINSYSIIYDELKKNGYLLSAPESIEEILRRAVGKELVLVPVKDAKGQLVGRKWWFKDPSTVPYIEQVPLRERVEVAVVGVLTRKIVATFDDILKEIFVKFPNSLIPDTESIRDILSEYANRTKDGRWRLKPSVQTRERQHNTIIELLCQLGEKAGFQVYGDISDRKGDLNLDIPQPKLERVKRIDALWIKKGRVEYSFEVENTTGITEGIVRAGNIPYANKRFILIPEERENLLARKVNEPAMKEMIEKEGWRFIEYGDFLTLANKFKPKDEMDPKNLEAIARGLPRGSRATTMDEFG